MLITALFLFYMVSIFYCVNADHNSFYNLDVCGVNNGRRLYLEYGQTGTLTAKYKDKEMVKDDYKQNVIPSQRCTIEFVTCPSCVVKIKFRSLNITRTCGKSPVYTSCGCDYVLIYEPPFEDVSGQQFCGRFIKSNVSELNYFSQTKTVKVAFIHNTEYGHAFTLDYSAERNKVQVTGKPEIGNSNNASQIVTSPFFPNFYPTDIYVEYTINCNYYELCRISLVFSDFFISDASILEFFDWNGQRIYGTSGNTYRPPVILSSGPVLVIRFYANGVTNTGFKASYFFILGNLNDVLFTPNIGCGGLVNNLGGAITMMDMVPEGTTFFDCIWIIKPPRNFLHRKTHLYVKVLTLEDFAGPTELTIKQGITSNQPSVEVLKYSLSQFNNGRQKEHIVPLDQGFYISLKGLFKPESRFAIVYAAFNYKDCFAGSEFLCGNLRCIPIILNCDGFDNCGDNSDESTDCSKYPTDHRKFSKIPNFFFPKINPYSDLGAATMIFVVCSFGLIGAILSLALLLYRLNVRTQHQRQIQDHIETIHAILEEGVGDVEEEIIIPDEPPDYEPPPDYSDVLKLLKSVACSKFTKRFYRNSSVSPERPSVEVSASTTVCEAGNSRVISLANTSRSCQTTPTIFPESPPPSYDILKKSEGFHVKNCEGEGCSQNNVKFASSSTESNTLSSRENEESTIMCFPYFRQPKIFNGIKKTFRKCKSSSTKNLFNAVDEGLVRSFSDSEMIFNSRINIPNDIKFKKSFSVDDLSAL